MKTTKSLRQIASEQKPYIPLKDMSPEEREKRISELKSIFKSYGK